MKETIRVLMNMGSLQRLFPFWLSGLIVLGVWFTPCFCWPSPMACWRSSSSNTPCTASFCTASRPPIRRL